MSNDDYITLFFSKSYEKTLDKLIRDDKDYVIPYEQLNNYIRTILSIPYKEYIDYICNNQLPFDIESKDITQSSSFSACEIEMCNALIWADNRGFDYLEIGKLFPQYVSHPNDAAYRKYGENQIKTSQHLGLVYEYYNYWYLSCLGYVYPQMKESDRLKLLSRTILRTPLYNKMMVDLMSEDIELTNYMRDLSRATQLRREGSVYRLLEICLKECKEEGIEIHQINRPSSSKHKIVSYDFVENKTMHSAAEPQNDSETKKKNNDTIDPKKLKSIFDNTATSYKYFWFLAIISLAKERDSLSITYKDILVRMAAMAWPIVMEYGIDLGKQDLIKKYLQEIATKERFVKSVPHKVVEYHLRLHYSLYGYERILSPLLLNVPYRFLSPWISFTTKEEVTRKSMSSQFNGLYSLIKDGIVLKKDWWIYVNSHYEEVYDFTNKSFLSYVKKYNEYVVLLPFMTNGWNYFKKEQPHNIEPYSCKGVKKSAEAVELTEKSDLMEIEHVYLDSKGNVIRTEIEQPKKKKQEEGWQLEAKENSKSAGQLIQEIDKRWNDFARKEAEKKDIEETTATKPVNDGSLKEQFRAFLAVRKSESTTNGYTSMLDSSIRKWINKVVDDQADSVFSFATVEDVQICIDLLKEIPGFREENARKHNGLTAALSQYLLFVKEREK